MLTEVGKGRGRKTGEKERGGQEKKGKEGKEKAWRVGEKYIC